MNINKCLTSCLFINTCFKTRVFKIFNELFWHPLMYKIKIHIKNTLEYLSLALSKF